MFPCVPEFPYYGTFVPMLLDWKMFISICSHVGEHLFPYVPTWEHSFYDGNMCSHVGGFMDDIESNTIYNYQIMVT